MKTVPNKSHIGSRKKPDYTRSPAAIEQALDIAEKAGPLADFLPPPEELAKAHIKIITTIRLDKDVIDWFKSFGQGYQTRINAVLKAYMKVHRK